MCVGENLSIDATCGREEERTKVTNFHASNWLFCPDHPRRRSPLTFCMRDRVREVIIHFKIRENRSRGFGAVGVENRPLPLTWLMAYATVCTTVQAAIV